MTPRVVVEHIRPQIDCGRFPIKRTPGEAVVVTAHVHADGHDEVRAVLSYRPAPEDPWIEREMTPLGNDEWRAEFILDRVGTAEYRVSGWIDHFASWRHAVKVKAAAEQDVTRELIEGAALVRSAARRIAEAANRAAPGDSETLTRYASRIAGPDSAQDRVRAALDDDLAALMKAHADRGAVTVSDSLAVNVERERARYGAWYEMFPRSAGTDARRSATFAEAAKRLDDIAELGFDVVYLPPIHPIGITHRKGKNNALVAAPGDPGSPWAIGSPAGGHTEIEPALGTIDDFDRFVAAAAERGLEIALDIAFQCSPDHPYVTSHPEWFRRGPDGHIKYAENPPKKYQDIYPLDFDSPAAPALWEELNRVIRYWASHGVRIFRVDNPHTKPYKFWEWLIRDVRTDYPDVVFLSEAFTRPKRMYQLAKLGFSQSYTYFTWRNTKQELVDYFTELTQTEVREFFRPNLFANTPDILHAFLQQGGREPFMIRAVLAATLGASYGIYSGFELCEYEAVPGTEEYLHSEKYEIRVRDWNRAGHIKDLIRSLNRIRRQHAALHFHQGLQFIDTDNPHILGYVRRSPDAGDALIVIVSLDPHSMQHGFVAVPPGIPGASPDAIYNVEDLLEGTTYTWSGHRNYVRFDPGVRVAHVFRVKR